MDLLIVVIASIAGVVLIEWLVRPRMLEHVREQMMKVAGAGHAGAAAPAQPVLAAGVPEVDLWVALRSAASAEGVRRRWEDAALRLLRRVLYVDLGFALLYLGLPALFSLGGDPLGIVVGLLLGIALTMIATLRHVLARRLYRAFTFVLKPPADAPSWRKGLIWIAIAVFYLFMVVVALALIVAGIAVGPIVWVLRLLLPRLGRPFTPRVRVMLSGAFVVLTAAIGATLAVQAPWPSAQAGGGVGLVLAALLHGTVLVMQGLQLRRMPGSSLLVLRVFDNDDTTDFTFNHLIRYWRWFGHHFTVVDCSLVRRSGANDLGWASRIALFAVLVAPGAALASAAQHWAWPGPSWLWAALSTAAIIGPATRIVPALGRRHIDGRFVRSRAQLTARLQRLDERPRNLDLSFRHERALCHDDTWFMAVGEFARRAQVVLMDLRGFSATNNGCQTEVDFLFDTVPAERIVFLVEEAQSELVNRMLIERWREQQSASPNLQLAAPQLKQYVCRTLDRADVQGILDLLIHSAEEPLAARAAS